MNAVKKLFYRVSGHFLELLVEAPTPLTKEDFEDNN